MERDSQQVNLGYAFVTFSHSVRLSLFLTNFQDEAKLALILAQNLTVEGLEFDLSIKNDKVDHKDFDPKFIINQQRNNAKLVNELQTLRESRQELRDFEANIDKDLVTLMLTQPSLAKLKKAERVQRRGQGGH